MWQQQRTAIHWCHIAIVFSIRDGYYSSLNNDVFDSSKHHWPLSFVYRFTEYYFKLCIAWWRASSNELCSLGAGAPLLSTALFWCDNGRLSQALLRMSFAIDTFHPCAPSDNVGSGVDSMLKRVQLTGEVLEWNTIPVIHCILYFQLYQEANYSPLYLFFSLTICNWEPIL